MPRERVQHGKLYVDDPRIEPTEVVGQSGEPVGLKAYAQREYIPGEELPTEAVITEQPSLDVTWNRDGGWVQLSIEAPRDWWGRFWDSLLAAEQSHYGVFSETLTRQEINHLIRTLRRARDAAFGADE